MKTWITRKRKSRTLRSITPTEAVKLLKKGFFCNIKDEPDGGSTLGFDMVGCSGKDISTIVLGCINLGAKLGLFDKKESEEISE